MPGHILYSPKCSALALHRAIGHRLLLYLLEFFTVAACGKVPMLGLVGSMFLPQPILFSQMQALPTEPLHLGSYRV